MPVRTSRISICHEASHLALYKPQHCLSFATKPTRACNLFVALALFLALSLALSLAHGITAARNTDFLSLDWHRSKRAFYFRSSFTRRTA